MMKPLRELSREQIAALSDDEIFELVATDIEAYQRGGPNRKAEHLALPRSAEMAEEIDRLWTEAEAKPQPSPEPEKPLVAPQIDAGLNVSGKPKSGFVPRIGNPKRRDPMARLYEIAEKGVEYKPEEEEEEYEEPEPAIEEEPEIGEVEWQPRKLTEPPVISIERPMGNARNFARDCLYLYHDAADGVLGTWYYHDEWWQWNGRFYERAPERRVWDLVYRAVTRTSDGDKRKYQVKPKHAEELMKCLRSCVSLHDQHTPPRWLDDRPSPPAEGLLVFRNRLVEAATGKDFPLNPQLWLHDGVDFDYDPNAQCPRWEWFLNQVFPGDVESQSTLEEFMGLGMTYDNQFEKGLGLIGEARSGKGTIAYIMELLVGPNAHVPLDIHKWLSTENSLEPLIGKKLGIFHDLRAKPPKAYGTVGYDAGGIDYRSAQKLLEIIAADASSFGRKYREAWRGNPTAKIVLISNKVPTFGDQTLANHRFVWLEFKVSFADKDDPRIKHVFLPAELSGIANRCLAGYRRLLARGRFIQPKTASALVMEVKEAVNPYLQFMNDCWVKDTDSKGPLASVFYRRFQDWMQENSRWDLRHSTKPNNLIRFVNKLPDWGWLKSVKPTGEPRRYPGICSVEEFAKRK